jgi:3-dehydroquinate dehydratase-1
MLAKPIVVKGKVLGGGRQPVVFMPLVARTVDALLAEAAAVLRKAPDLIEWRVDFFGDIALPGKVLDTAARLRRIAGPIPLLLTRRSAREGGHAVELSDEAVLGLYSAVCKARCVDFIDFEMSSPPEHIRRLRGISREHEIGMILSYHDFAGTPGLEALSERFLQAERLGGDIAKVAVTAKRPQDVLTLLAATERSAQALKIPLVAMAMGGYGSLTRLFGWVFGSSATFALGASASAPGQVPVEDLNAVAEILRRALRG